MAEYTNILNVSNELNGYSINSSTTPSDVTVLKWIEEASSEIDNATGMVWDKRIVSNEVHDYDGSGTFHTYNNPILSVTSLYKEVNGVGGSSESWTLLSEGRLSTQDFMVYKPEGEIVFHGSRMPQAGFQNLKVSYSYGFSTTPVFIERLATLMVAKRMIYSVQSGSATNEGGTVSVGTITVSDPTTFGTNHLKSMSEEINSLFAKAGTLKTYRLDRRY